MHTASAILNKAKETLEQRGRDYDQEFGERSMSKTINAFNAITGYDLAESDGWLIMVLLKQVRQDSAKGYHADSALDAVSYSALYAESLSREDGFIESDESLTAFWVHAADRPHNAEQDKNISNAACKAFWDHWSANGMQQNGSYYQSTHNAINAYLETMSSQEGVG